MNGAELASRARDLAALFEAHARESEELRRPADAVIQAACDAELFKLMVPEAYGGFGLDLPDLVDVVMPLAEADASLAWVTSFYIEHNWWFCLFPESFQRDFFASRDYVLAPATVAPAGQCVPVTGGYRLSGRWSWATGVMHGEWAIVGSVVRHDPPKLDMRFFAVPQSEIKVEDVWHVDGMCGTGSNDMVVDDLFVPEERSLSALDTCEGRAPGAGIHAGALYRTPMFPLLATAAAVPAVGQARGIVRRFQERLGTRVTMPTGSVQGERPAAQIRLAWADTEAHAAELLLRDAVRELCELRDRTTAADRIRLRARIARAVHMARAVVIAVQEASGASAHFLDGPIQRAVRDLNMLACHIVFDLDTTYEIHGRSLLGRPPESPLV